MSADERSQALLAWYHRQRRPFPWRSTTDPWALLVVEVMSQQTQIDRVLAHWERWRARFPTPEDCATADLTDVLSLWSGLGYNRRAVRLRAAATEVAASGWPTTAAGLATLPGVGPYTAAAVACQAFGEQVPTIDTNLRRVISRWVGRPLAGKALTETAVTLLPDGLAEDWNQAVMDLAAGICRPSPGCETCPVDRWCADPTVYAPPRGQAPFAGSSREVRGAVLRALLGGPASEHDLAVGTGHPVSAVRRALDALFDDGLVVDRGDTWRIP